MPKLVREGIEHVIALSDQKPYFLIGRGVGNDLMLKGRECSRYHAAIYRDPENKDGVRLVNYSQNGTYINDTELTDATLTLHLQIEDAQKEGKKGPLESVWKREERPAQLADIDAILSLTCDEPKKLNEASVALQEGDVIRFGIKKMEFTYRV